MSFRHQRSGYLGYSLLLLTLLFAPLAIAQSDTTAAQQPSKPAEGTSVQARIRVRRQQRTAQAITEIYGHKYEVYFGGGFQRFLPGKDLQHVNEASWNGGFTDYLTRKLALTGDVRGSYGSAYTYNNPYSIHLPSIYQYTFLAGPQYRVYARPRYSISARVLAGGSYGNFNGDTRTLGSLLGLYPDGTAFAVNAALPIDLNVTPRVALRLSPDYLLTTFGSTTQHNRGFTAGIVYRFGKQQ